MKPSDLILIGLLVQGAALGRGAVTTFYAPLRGRWFFLPLLVVISYYVFAAFYPPPGIRHGGPPNPHAWTDAWRYLVLVAAFTLTVEMLLGIIKRQGTALKRGSV